MGQDAVAFLEVLDIGAQLQNLAGDVFAEDEGVGDSEAIVSGWGVADFPVDGAAKHVSEGRICKRGGGCGDELVCLSIPRN